MSYPQSPHRSPNKPDKPPISSRAHDYRSLPRFQYNILQQSPISDHNASSFSTNNLATVSSTSDRSPKRYSPRPPTSYSSMGPKLESTSSLTSPSISKLPAFLNFDPYKVDDLSYLQRNYENLLREFENLQEKMSTTMTSIKSFWSPELKKERMLRKEESSKCLSLQEQLKSAGQESRKQTLLIEQLKSSCLNSQMPCHSDMVIAATLDHDIILAERNRLMHEALIANDRINDLETELVNLRIAACKKVSIGGQAELDMARCRIQDLETRCRHLESIIDLKDQDLSILRNECLNASEKFRELEKRGLTESASSPTEDQQNFQSLIDSKNLLIEHQNQRLSLYEEEIKRLKAKVCKERLVNDNEVEDLKNRLELSELAFSQKQLEMQALQARAKMTDEHLGQLKKNLEAMESSISIKNNILESLQKDVDEASLVRANIELKVATLQKENQQLSNQLSLIKTQKDEELQKLTSELKSMNEEIINRQNDKCLFDNNEANEMRSSIETLQKEIIDRQVLIESQNEKISDSNKETQNLKQKIDSLISTINEKEREIDQLKSQSADQEKLLQIVHAMDKDSDGRLVKNLQSAESASDKRGLNVDYVISEEFDKWSLDLRSMFQGSNTDKEMKKFFDDSQAQCRETEEAAKTFQTNLYKKNQRINELEEALKESVSITAEREMVIAQQKRACEILEEKIRLYKEQAQKFHAMHQETDKKFINLQKDFQEKQRTICGFGVERKQQLEEVLQLKEEYLLAAISEKDAHIALLESGNLATERADEIETLRLHKQKLMKRLKAENAKRLELLSVDFTNAAESDVGDFAASKILLESLKSAPSDQIARCLEVRKKRYRTIIDELLAEILTIDPDLILGLPRTQQSNTYDSKTLLKMNRRQLLFETRNRLIDCCDLNKYANLLIIRLRPFNKSKADAHHKAIQRLNVAQIWLPPKLKKLF